MLLEIFLTISVVCALYLSYLLRSPQMLDRLIDYIFFKDNFALSTIIIILVLVLLGVLGYAAAIGLGFVKLVA